MFEPGLARDNTTDVPCANRGYSLYYETETHGVWPVTATVDLYNPGAELILKQQAEMKNLEGQFNQVSEKVKDVSEFAKNIQTIISTGKAVEEVASFLY